MLREGRAAGGTHWWAHSGALRREGPTSAWQEGQVKVRIVHLGSAAMPVGTLNGSLLALPRRASRALCLSGALMLHCVAACSTGRCGVRRPGSMESPAALPRAGGAPLIANPCPPFAATPSPGANVSGGCPVPAQMWPQSSRPPAESAHCLHACDSVRQAGRGAACCRLRRMRRVDATVGAAHRNR